MTKNEKQIIKTLTKVVKQVAKNPQKDRENLRELLNKAKVIIDNYGFLNSCADSKIRRKLYNLLDEVDYVASDYDFPVSLKSWRVYNPNLRFFECGFDLLPEFYLDVKRGETEEHTLQFLKERLRFLPTQEDFWEREEYFNQRTKNLSEKNIQKVYQKEMLETLQNRFNDCLKAAML